VTDETTPEDLFALLGEAIAPLEDAHTSITSESLGRVGFMRPDPELNGSTSIMEAIGTVEQKFARAVEIIQTRYLEGELRSFCNGHLRYGELPGEIAYVYLDQEGGYTDQPGFAATLEVMEAALDTIFTAAREATGLILDVRKNYGGSDILSLALASRLATSEYTAYAKVARAEPNAPERRTEPQPRSVPTTTRPSFSGAVAQLTGRYTISAGETLTQALMGREPHVTRIGEHTQGVFSDVMGRTLPNGWEFALPNELFLTEDGVSFDGPGIPPDIEVPVFRDADLEAGHDPALERAMAYLEATGAEM
jgi:C-terminal processing protease CtpA/Prc